MRQDICSIGLSAGPSSLCVPGMGPSASHVYNLCHYPVNYHFADGGLRLKGIKSLFQATQLVNDGAGA